MVLPEDHSAFPIADAPATLLASMLLSSRMLRPQYRRELRREDTRQADGLCNLSGSSVARSRDHLIACLATFAGSKYEIGKSCTWPSGSSLDSCIARYRRLFRSYMMSPTVPGVTSS